ncbi:hypothetical protein Goari_022763 [Gossypium aridum]|uniref:non-specific serine/threonine protein kinase n=1 Tax=Gossypium aridum TaxID=34290 RepID=A0A7J8YLJ5_GOSAI|nr:hypothetical protein [Gossypium aridum]
MVDLGLSNNWLVGQIPSSVSNLTNLASLFLQNNKLNGSIPKDIGRLTNLVELHLSFNRLSGHIPSTQGQAKALKHDPSPTKNRDLFSIWNFDGKITFEDIIKATEDFDIKYCIGMGGYGSVYRAVLPSGKIVSLKKLHRLEAE